MANPFEAFKQNFHEIHDRNASNGLNLVDLATQTEVGAATAATGSAIVYPLSGLAAAGFYQATGDLVMAGDGVYATGLAVGAEMAILPTLYFGSLAAQADLARRHPDIAASAAVSVASGPGL